MEQTTPTLLLNMAQYKAVGHLVEAVKWARGYADEDPDLRIELVVGADAPIALLEGCPWIARAYPVSTDEVARKGAHATCLQDVPRAWDYVISSFRLERAAERDEDAAATATHRLLSDLLVAREARGYTPAFARLDAPEKLADQVLPYRLNAPVRISVPEAARRRVEQLLQPGFRICILPTGSIGANSPSPAGWTLVCQALGEAFPDAQVYFTGIAKTLVDRAAWHLSRRPFPRRPITGTFTRADVRHLNRLPRTHDCFDIGFWNQIALLEAADLLVAPHTGFAFLAQCVGTPWLAISACRWHEYLFNDVPFASVLPDCGSYPAWFSTGDGCGRLLANGQRSVCATDEHVESKIPEIVEAATQLRSDGFGYEEALRAHLRKIESANVIRERFVFFDGMGDWADRVSADSGF